MLDEMETGLSVLLRIVVFGTPANCSSSVPSCSISWSNIFCQSFSVNVARFSVNVGILKRWSICN